VNRRPRARSARKINSSTMTRARDKIRGAGFTGVRTVAKRPYAQNVYSAEVEAHKPPL
jgi:hypothetical protein